MALRRRPMESGERDWVIQVESRPVADAVDPDSGEPVDGPWTTLVASLPASRRDVLGLEPFKSDQISAWQRSRWETNYRTDLDPELIDVAKLRRIVHQGRVHNIIAASVIGRREGIEFITLQKVG